MTEVVVVCAAGASSTFLARRLTELASAAGLSWSFTPAPVDSIPDVSTAVVAITSLVATPEVLDSFTSHGIRHVVLPDTVRGVFGAEDALMAIVTFATDANGLADSVVHPHAAKGAI
jgi:galactitol-specific phosphotransferase system IIB component